MSSKGTILGRFSANRTIRRTAAWLALAFWGTLIFLFVSVRYLHFSTNSAALYVLKDADGYRLATDLLFDEADSLVFRVDATPLLNKLFETTAVATDSAYLDFRYDPNKGKGIIKQFRPDATRLELSLARYDELGVHPHGLIIGGEFPPGDVDSTAAREGSGMALFDGTQWIHLWCSANEGIGVAGGGPVYEPHRWKYISGRILKKTFDEIILESKHGLNMAGTDILITRRLGMTSTDDFVTLSVTLQNMGDRGLWYDYAYGDEPWLGTYGSSEGDVGWYPGGWVYKESYIDPLEYHLAGFVDIGNPQAGESGEYTRYGNFIQWEGPPPQEVYFSNDFFSVDPGRPLLSKDNRILNIVWKDQELAPGENRMYRFKIGFVLPGKSFATAMNKGEHPSID